MHNCNFARKEEHERNSFINDGFMFQANQQCIIARKDENGTNLFINDGFVFHANKLCILNSYVHHLLLYEVQGGGLICYFGMKETKGMLVEHFFWFRMQNDVEKFVAYYTTCQKLSHDSVLIVYTSICIFPVYLGNIYPCTLC